MPLPDITQVWRGPYTYPYLTALLVFGDPSPSIFDNTNCTLGLTGFSSAFRSLSDICRRVTWVHKYMTILPNQNLAINRIWYVSSSSSNWLRLQGTKVNAIDRPEKKSSSCISVGTVVARTLPCIGSFRDALDARVYTGQS